MPVFLLSYLSLASAKNLTWPYGPDSTFASLVAFYLPYSIKILALDRMPCNPEVSSHNWSFINCYRIWNNPRNLPSQSPLIANHKHDDGRMARLGFAIRMVVKAATLWAFDSIVFQRILFQAFTHVKAADSSPAIELTALGRALLMLTRELRL